MKRSLQVSRKETKRKPMASYANKMGSVNQKATASLQESLCQTCVLWLQLKVRDSSLSLEQAQLAGRNLLASIKTWIGMEVSPTDGDWGESSKPHNQVEVTSVSIWPLLDSRLCRERKKKESPYSAQDKSLLRTWQRQERHSTQEACPNSPISRESMALQKKALLLSQGTWHSWPLIHCKGPKITEGRHRTKTVCKTKCVYFAETA